MNTSIPDILPSQGSSASASPAPAAPPAKDSRGFSDQLGKAQAKTRKSTPANAPRVAKPAKSPQTNAAPAQPAKSKATVQQSEPVETTEDQEDQPSTTIQAAAQAPEKPKAADQPAQAQSKQASNPKTQSQLPDVTAAIDEQSDEEPSDEHSPDQKSKAQETAAPAAGPDVAMVAAAAGTVTSAAPARPIAAPLDDQTAPTAAVQAGKPNVSPFKPADTGQTTAADDGAADQADAADAADVADVKEHAVAKAEPTLPTSNPAAVDAAGAKTTVAHTATVAAAPAPAPDVQFTENNHPQIVAAIHGQLLPNGGTMNIRLAPPDLGAMQIMVKMEGGTMSASFETSNDEATRLLSHTLSQLKGALESQGVSVARLHVQQASKPQEQGESASDDKGRQQGGANQQSAQQEQQRREMLRRMWRRAGYGRDPLDLVA